MGFFCLFIFCVFLCSGEEKVKYVILINFETFSVFNIFIELLRLELQ